MPKKLRDKFEFMESTYIAYDKNKGLNHKRRGKFVQSEDNNKLYFYMQMTGENSKNKIRVRVYLVTFMSF